MNTRFIERKCVAQHTYLGHMPRHQWSFASNQKVPLGEGWEVPCQVQAGAAVLHKLTSCSWRMPPCRANVFDSKELTN